MWTSLRQTARTTVPSREVSSPYLNFRTTGTVMRGDGRGATLEALPIPLGSIITLFSPPAFAGPGAIPLIGKLPDPAAPAIRAACANEAAAPLFDEGVCITEADLGLSSRRHH